MLWWTKQNFNAGHNQQKKSVLITLGYSDVDYKIYLIDTK